jgi:xylulokinase
MTDKRILVLDVGTSALKAAMFDGNGSIVASAEADYGDQPAPHRQRIEDWWEAARRAIAEIGDPRCDAIALSGTMENLIAVDSGGRPVFDAILYSDPCGEAVLDAHRARLDALGAPSIIGNVPEPLMTAFKIGWIGGAHPAAFAAARYFLPGAKDAIALRLTGRAATDPVTATTTGMMDLSRRSWSAPVIEALGIPADKLPEILAADATIGVVTAKAARQLGLAPGTPVINGCGDAGATTLGSFCREAGDISLYLGTSGWVARVAADTKRDASPSVYRLAHPVSGRIIEIAPILSAGASGDWIRKTLALDESERDAALAKADRMPTDLVFLPYLSGERFPFFDSYVRGAFIGLDTAHQRHDLYYAVLEGVGLAIAANLTAIDHGGEGRIRLAGGGAQSTVWPKMLADLIGRPLSIPPDPANATATGAFLVAAEMLGLEQPPSETMTLVTPRQERKARSQRLREMFASATAAARRLRRPG